MCQVCKHPDRNVIETQILSGIPFEDVAQSFEINKDVMKVHCFRHMNVSEVASAQSKVLTKVKSKETLILQDTALSFFYTLKNLEKYINKKIADEDLRKIPKHIVDLYLGSGTEVRQAVDSLMKSINILDGNANNVIGQISELVSAINNSRNGGEA